MDHHGTDHHSTGKHGTDERSLHDHGGLPGTAIPNKSPRTRGSARQARRRIPAGGRKLTLQAMAEDMRTGHDPKAPALLASTHYTPPVTELRRLNASRLLPARYSDSVLTRIADTDEDLQLIYALDNATNERLLAEANNRLGITARELVFRVPSARIINAAFTHPHPLGARFSTPYRGAWYAAFELATAKAEVLFHRMLQMSEIRWNEREDLDYDHYYADFAGPFHDLRLPVTEGRTPRSIKAAEAMRAACLNPDSYMESQQLAVDLLEAGSLGVLYPSVRRAEGTCLACFRPSIVSNVRKRDLHRLTWRPDAPPTFTRVPRPSPE